LITEEILSPHGCYIVRQNGLLEPGHPHSLKKSYMSGNSYQTRRVKVDLCLKYNKNDKRVGVPVTATNSRLFL
jgi:hypothetical protein